MSCRYCDNGCNFVGKVIDVIAHELECMYYLIANSPVKLETSQQLESLGYNKYKCSACGALLMEVEQPYHDCVTYL